MLLLNVWLYAHDIVHSYIHIIYIFIGSRKVLELSIVSGDGLHTMLIQMKDNLGNCTWLKMRWDGKNCCQHYQNQQPPDLTPTIRSSFSTKYSVPWLIWLNGQLKEVAGPCPVCWHFSIPFQAKHWLLLFQLWLKLRSEVFVVLPTFPFHILSSSTWCRWRQEYQSFACTGGTLSQSQTATINGSAI